jgi:hypothetical protein
LEKTADLAGIINKLNINGCFTSFAMTTQYLGERESGIAAIYKGWHIRKTVCSDPALSP